MLGTDKHRHSKCEECIKDLASMVHYFLIAGHGSPRVLKVPCIKRYIPCYHTRKNGEKLMRRQNGLISVGLCTGMQTNAGHLSQIKRVQCRPCFNEHFIDFGLGVPLARTFGSPRGSRNHSWSAVTLGRTSEGTTCFRLQPS